MRITILLFFICFASFSGISQSLDISQQIEQVQIAIGSLVSKRERAEIMLRDLTELEGSVIALTEDTFSLKIKGMNGKQLVARISYQEVLVIKSKTVSISLIPDPTSRLYGSWDDVLKISYNYNLEAILENGQSVVGRIGGITKDKLTLITDKDNEKIELLRDQIVFVYRVRRESDKTGDGLVSGANKGRKTGEVIGEVIGATRAARVFDIALGTLVGAGVGAVSGAAQKQEKFRVLIYSK